MAKIFESQIVDYETGEIKSVTTITANKSEETFGMHRSTEGVDWVLKFKGIELQMVIFLLELENIKSGIITISSLQKQSLLDKFKISASYYHRIISNLIDSHTLVKLSPSDFLLNPCYFYKGGTKLWKSKYDFFMSKLPTTDRQEPNNI